MIKQLKNVFPSLILYQPHMQIPSDTYKWFIANNNEIIGIAKKELTEKEENLLQTFLQPYSIQFPEPTPQEEKWKNIIHGAANGAGNPASAYRFVYFKFKQNQISPPRFKESMDTLFSSSVPILWENENEGILIEETKDLDEENVSYEQIINILMSDLYVKISFLVGPYMESFALAGKHYKTLIESAQIGFTYTDKQVLSFTEVVPYLLIDRMEKPLQDELNSLLLKDCGTDTELLHDILTFFRCNLNVSVAAKELHMHRNSLQYRLDKFFDKTGIDLRQFHQALTVYLTILVNMHKEQ